MCRYTGSTRMTAPSHWPLPYDTRRRSVKRSGHLRAPRATAHFGLRGHDYWPRCRRVEAEWSSFMTARWFEHKPLPVLQSSYVPLFTVSTAYLISSGLRYARVLLQTSLNDATPEAVIIRTTKLYHQPSEHASIPTLKMRLKYRAV